MLGTTVPEAMLFEEYEDAERYAQDILIRLQAINYQSPCAQRHLSDVTTCTITWFSITITSQITMKIPNCMHRHLMQHLTTSAILLHAPTYGIEVSLENMCFTTRASDFMTDHGLNLGDVVFRHIGFFTFETFLYSANDNKKKGTQSSGPILNFPSL
ncbi:uncharacterized protein LOC115999506 [Ipomoea triloba]|uniref:uncharacterized protein LOC115999505 n=1 Tax=Ipomoea triloba TaxID=35885 RepID=UPI00125D20B4|nr:uncharacterized protein LOC115999505 [Ipomoea triloba]XP_031095214.1 uncharacterized protein LOC115999506 [Ipomoea triloba]